MARSRIFRPREVNRIALHFWTDGHLATDFDVQAKFNNEWKTVREVRGNRERVVRAVFPTIRTETLRILFRRQIPDNMVRLYEFTADRMEQPVAVTLSAAFHGGLLLPGRRPNCCWITVNRRKPSSCRSASACSTNTAKCSNPASGLRGQAACRSAPASP